jgi:hypothetical protein
MPLVFYLIGVAPADGTGVKCHAYLTGIYLAKYLPCGIPSAEYSAYQTGFRDDFRSRSRKLSPYSTGLAL